MDQIRITKVNETYFEIEAEDSIRQELSDHFCFTVPNAKFMKQKGKRRGWDGKIRLFNLRTNRIYVGLANRIEKFAKDRDYEVVYENEVDDYVDYELLEKIYKSIDRSSLNEEQLDFQLQALLYCVKKGRATILSPTASGKSFILYLLSKYYLNYLYEPKVLIIVPTTGLVVQLATDFFDYGAEEDDIHQVMSGTEKQASKDITISTWQSIYKLDEDYFSQYDVIMVDEAHEAEAKSICGIMEKAVETMYRFGFTGTLRESKTNEMVLNGIFGPIKKISSTKQLIDAGVLSDVQIENVILTYPDKEKKLVSNQHKAYTEEMDYIIHHERRRQYITKMVGEMKGNTLVLYRFVEKHGIPQMEMIEKNYPNKQVFIVHGGIDTDIRDDIRHIAEENDDCIIVASYGTFSTGINIKNLHNIVFAGPYKSKIKVMQSLGRGLRRHPTKKKLYLIDIVDDLKWGSRTNHVLKHFAERLRMYNEEQLVYNIHKVDL